MALLGEMKLELAAGPEKISVLADRTVQNPNFSEVAFIWTGARLFAAELFNFRSIGQQQIFRVELDDGGIVEVSPTSRFVTKSGGLKMAPELSPGESLLPLYIEEDAHGYPTYRVPGLCIKQKIYRLMAEWKVGHPLKRGTVVEHIDKDRKNFHPDNLKITPNKRSGKKSHKHKLVKAYKAAQEVLDECAAASPAMAEIVGRHRRTNHKVVSVTPGPLKEVFTASVRSEGYVSVSGVFLELPS